RDNQKRSMTSSLMPSTKRMTLLINKQSKRKGDVHSHAFRRARQKSNKPKRLIQLTILFSSPSYAPLPIKE
ncbi:hypothetical protein ACOIXN_003530, partial [Vibrio vulnificus]